MAAEMIRINTRISKTVNDFLDAKSEESGVPKSTLIYLALEQYMNQQRTLEMLPHMQALAEHMERLKGDTEAFEHMQAVERLKGDVGGSERTPDGAR